MNFGKKHFTATIQSSMSDPKILSFELLTFDMVEAEDDI